ncbi:MAG: diaminopimelate decarboxylase [Endomicrobiales bacterium]|jgi:diaminopimelate decarboxylase
MLSYRDNVLFCENISLEKVARRFGTPVYIYSRAQLVSNFDRFKTAFSDVSHLICYATKANANHAILTTLFSRGAGADITSGGELFRSLEAGFDPKKIVYAGIGKTAQEIEYALKSGILIFNVESMEELAAINGIAARLKKKASIAFRINPDVDAQTHRYITTGTGKAKFGIPYDEAGAAYRMASRLAHIDVAGIHCHIGSQITTVRPFHHAAVKIEKLRVQLQKSGISLRYVNMGGGLGIQYADEVPPTPGELHDSVIPVFKDFSGTFIFEPGRYIVGNAGVLLVSVVYRKNTGGKNYLIIDGAMNDLIRPTLYEAYHNILPAKKSSRPPVKADIVGPICETGDFLGLDRMLALPDPGDRLAVMCTGAYGMAMSSQYNSRLRAAEVMIDGSHIELIRRRETYADLIHTELQGKQ